MIALDISPEEVASGTMAPDHVQAAANALKADGFVVLNDIVDPAHAAVLRDRMLEDVQALIARSDAPFNWNVGNLQQDPPPFPPYLFEDILLNKMVLAVTQAVLGAGVKNTLYSGNTAMPSDCRQPVHADIGHLWPGLDAAHPPVHLVVNVPVVDMGPENGSTEIWPGTHRDLTVTAGKDIEIPAEVLEQRRAVCPPLQPVVRCGGVLLRDMRLWHAGMPNRTTRPRPMIAMIHVPAWLATEDSLVFPKESEAFFAHSALRTCARFVDGPIDHIRAPHGYKAPKPA